MVLIKIADSLIKPLTGFCERKCEQRRNAGSAATEKAVKEDLSKRPMSFMRMIYNRDADGDDGAGGDNSI